MRRESHVRFWESAGVRFPRATRLVRSVTEECLNRLVILGRRFSVVRSSPSWNTLIGSGIIRACRTG